MTTSPDRSQLIRPKGMKKPRYSFAVIADTHVNEVEVGGTSPYETNTYANQRARHVFEQVAQIQSHLAFVVHLGDIVHPVPGLPSFEQAVTEFKGITSCLKIPLYCVPGNHDVGDKKVDWMPADQVCSAYLKKYRHHFGPDFFKVDYGADQLLFLNTVLMNSGLPEETQQKEWLESVLREPCQGHRFVFMHYPPYLWRPDEPGNYDNIDQPERAWLLNALEQATVETIFAGHVHNFWLDRIGAAKFYMLPSTAFMRHDFSAFYRIAPAVEFGRGDPGRFGYFLVDVFDDESVSYSIRTQGERQENPGENRSRPIFLAHPKVSHYPNVGVELRHPWAQSEQIAATGGVQEFGRKFARNDYPLQALLEIGARLVKVPEIDLRTAESRDRIPLLRQSGISVWMTKLGAPNQKLLALGELPIDAMECNQRLDDFTRVEDDYKSFTKATGIDLYLAPLRDEGLEKRTQGHTFSHFIRSGFLVSELQNHASWMRSMVKTGCLRGVVVRHEFEEDLAEAAELCAAWARACSCQVQISVKTAGPSTALLNDDMQRLSVLTDQALSFSLRHPELFFVFDTFLDVDRGYYPRLGFVDGHFNLRPAGLVWQKAVAMSSKLD
ncbi:MAG: metallophosphoesterase [Burkholderiaceae bacterium]